MERKKTEQLRKLLKGIDGLEFHCDIYYPPPEGKKEWGQTRLYFAKRNELYPAVDPNEKHPFLDDSEVIKELYNSAHDGGIGLLTHTQWRGNDLEAKLYALKELLAGLGKRKIERKSKKLMQEQREYVRGIYEELISGLKKLGYEIKELPKHVPVEGCGLITT